jgi:putative transposase
LPETIQLIHQMTKDNLLWGAERIRGELLKLGIKISKRTMGVMQKPPSWVATCRVRQQYLK